MLPALLRFWRHQAATTAIECGLIAVGISVVIVAVVNAIGANFGIGTLAASAATRSPANSGPVRPRGRNRTGNRPLRSRRCRG